LLAVRQVYRYCATARELSQNVLHVGDRLALLNRGKGERTELQQSVVDERVQEGVINIRYDKRVALDMMNRTRVQSLNQPNVCTADKRDLFEDTLNFLPRYLKIKRPVPVRLRPH